ncbi:YcaO-like family protein [Streptomyces sp. Je 1-79]|nr:YcaO-like family protein [Streptomyces sp. Je 1-79]
MTRDLPITWTAGQDLRTGRETWVPASLSYVNYYPEPAARGWVPRPPVESALVLDPLPFS